MPLYLLIDNQSSHHFELSIEGAISFVEYVLRGDTYLLTHTEVPEAQRGAGIAAALVKSVLERIKQEGNHMVPICPYINAYLARYPEYETLVDNEIS